MMWRRRGFSQTVWNTESGNKSFGRSSRADYTDEGKDYDSIAASSRHRTARKPGRGCTLVSVGTLLDLLEQVLEDLCAGAVRVEYHGNNLGHFTENAASQTESQDVGQAGGTLRRQAVERSGLSRFLVHKRERGRWLRHLPRWDGNSLGLERPLQ